MNNLLIVLVTVAICWAQVVAPALVEVEEPEPPEAVEQYRVSGRLLAAFLVAYEADRAWFEERHQVDLTPREFARRHMHAQLVRLADGTFVVEMGPESEAEGPHGLVRFINWGRRYSIGEHLELREAYFDR